MGAASAAKEKRTGKCTGRSLRSRQQEEYDANTKLLHAPQQALDEEDVLYFEGTLNTPTASLGLFFNDLKKVTLSLSLSRKAARSRKYTRHEEVFLSLSLAYSVCLSICLSLFLSLPRFLSLSLSLSRRACARARRRRSLAGQMTRGKAHAQGQFLSIAGRRKQTQQASATRERSELGAFAAACEDFKAGPPPALVRLTAPRPKAAATDAANAAAAAGKRSAPTIRRKPARAKKAKPTDGGQAASAAPAAKPANSALASLAYDSDSD